MKFKGAIFDLDGVICFTDEYHYLAWKKLADDLGIYFDREINQRLRGVSRMESLDIILERSDKEYTPNEKLEFATRKNNLYREYLKEMKPSDVTDEVRDTLKKLKELGFLTAIGSSSKNTPIILENTNSAYLFDKVVDGNDIKNSKPDPEVFLCAAHKLGLKPEECFVVEDAKAGIDAAKAGGFIAIGIGDASTYDKTDYPIKTFKDILKVVDKLNND